MQNIYHAVSHKSDPWKIDCEISVDKTVKVIKIGPALKEKDKNQIIIKLKPTC